MEEIWKDIPNYEGKYFISNYGRLMNSSGLVMKPMICTNGYLSACLWRHNKQQKILIHRLVAMVFLKKPKNCDEINHIDEDKTNNCVSNLEWCTHLYNMNYGNVNTKISIGNKGRVLTPEHRAKCASALGKKWMYKGSKEILVKEGEIPSFLINNWNLGRRLKECMRK